MAACDGLAETGSEVEAAMKLFICAEEASLHNLHLPESQIYFELLTVRCDFLEPVGCLVK